MITDERQPLSSAGEQFMEAAGAAAAACAADMDAASVAGLLWAFGTLVRSEPSPVSAAAAAGGGPPLRRLRPRGMLAMLRAVTRRTALLASAFTAEELSGQQTPIFIRNMKACYFGLVLDEQLHEESWLHVCDLVVHMLRISWQHASAPISVSLIPRSNRVGLREDGLPPRAASGLPGRGPQSDCLRTPADGSRAHRLGGRHA